MSPPVGIVPWATQCTSGQLHTASSSNLAELTALDRLPHAQTRDLAGRSPVELAQVSRELSHGRRVLLADHTGTSVGWVCGRGHGAHRVAGVHASVRALRAARTVSTVTVTIVATFVAAQ